MNERALMSDKSVRNAYQADQAYLKRVDERVAEIMADKELSQEILSDNFMHLVTFLANLITPDCDALEAQKVFAKEVEKLAKEKAEREIKPSEMDDFREPLE